MSRGGPKLVPFGREHADKCPMARICHCLLVAPSEMQFYVCCGYWHTICGGRRVDYNPKRPR